MCYVLKALWISRVTALMHLAHWSVCLCIGAKCPDGLLIVYINFNKPALACCVIAVIIIC